MAEPDYECEDCIGMIEHGCYCMAHGSPAPGGPANAWEYWQQRAHKAEGELADIRRALSIHDAWPIVLKWINDYQDEQEWFGPYRDYVILDGIMTAEQRRAIHAALTSGQPK